jgi:hypothetical protein
MTAPAPALPTWTPITSAQDGFDRVLAHLRAQGRQSLSDGIKPVCVYGEWGGLQCAIGCLMEPNNPDRTSDVRFSLISFDGKRFLEGFSERYANTLGTQLQILHDCPAYWSFPGGFNVAGEYAAKEFAADFGLEYRGIAS